MPDFTYYKPINSIQDDFHKSKATNKLLIGAYRSGKTYPAIHEALFICGDNPGHEFGVFRNTQDSLERNIQKDFLVVAEKAGAVKNWKKSTGELILWNDCIVRFVPLSVSRAQLKGMNMCGFLIDDPDVDRYKEVISFLFTRLTNPPGVEAAYFTTIICANFEGHDWLWQKYMRRRKQGGDGMFAYWLCKTEDNTTLPEDYIKIQESLHSEAWMKRYIHGDQNAYVGLVHDEYDPEVHDADLSWCERDNSLLKGWGSDLGITHPTVVLQVACDYENLYFYNEFYKTDLRTDDLGEYLIQIERDQKFFVRIMDPKSCAREQTSGVSPRQILKKDFGIHGIKNADNNIRTGIEVVKSLMTVREKEDPNNPGQMEKVTHIYIDPVRCPNLVRELETLKWKEPEYSDFEELAYREEPIDKDNDCTDTMRYLCMHFKKYLTGTRIEERRLEVNKLDHWDNRFKKLKIYAKHPGVVGRQRSALYKNFSNNRMAALKQFHQKGILN